MTWAHQERLKIYVDAGTSMTYVCDALKGTALTDSKWRVTKCHLDASGNIEETWTNAGYVSPATSLLVVAALTFS